MKILSYLIGREHWKKPSWDFCALIRTWHGKMWKYSLLKMSSALSSHSSIPFPLVLFLNFQVLSYSLNLNLLCHPIRDLLMKYQLFPLWGYQITIGKTFFSLQLSFTKSLVFLYLTLVRSLMLDAFYKMLADLWWSIYKSETLKSHLGAPCLWKGLWLLGRVPRWLDRSRVLSLEDPTCQSL